MGASAGSGRILVTSFKLIPLNSPPIVSIDPIYAYFSMDELAALRYQRLLREGKLASSQDGKVPVYLQLQDETGFHHEGTIDFSDNSVDSSTGTLLIRASFISIKSMRRWPHGSGAELADQQ